MATMPLTSCTPLIATATHLPRIPQTLCNLLSTVQQLHRTGSVQQFRSTGSVGPNPHPSLQQGNRCTTDAVTTHHCTAARVGVLAGTLSFAYTSCSWQQGGSSTALAFLHSLNPCLRQRGLAGVWSRAYCSWSAQQRESSSGLAFLDSFLNYERQGVPAGAGTLSSAHFDMSRMMRLLQRLGNPQRKWRAVHVAGTKGKGSTVAFISSILHAAGYKVGSYTSPHVHHLTERITVGTSSISATCLDALVSEHESLLKEAQQEELGALTHFEVLTALAFRHFADEGMEVVVVETGLGGLMDATNVFDSDNLAAAVITPIGLDHLDALGGSIRSIAAAKAGILKPRRPVVLAGQPHQEAEEQVLAAAQKLECPVMLATTSASVTSRGWSLSDAAKVTPFTQLAHETVDVHVAEAGWQLQGVDLKLGGSHQHDNISTACAAVQCLTSQGWEIRDAAVHAGLSRAFLPGRLQVLPLATGSGRTHHLILDGAHTAESAQALSSTVRTHLFPTQPLVLVVAMAGDKPHLEVIQQLRILKPKVVIFTSVPIGGSYDRSCPPGTLVSRWQAAAFLDRNVTFRCRELIQASMAAALDKAQHELHAFGQPGVVCVTGSLHAVAQAYRHAV